MLKFCSQGTGKALAPEIRRYGQGAEKNTVTQRLATDNTDDVAGDLSHQEIRQHGGAQIIDRQPAYRQQGGDGVPIIHPSGSN